MPAYHYSSTDLDLLPPAPLHFRHEQYLANTDFEWHIHPWGQINRISLGILELQLPDRTLAAPAEYLVWIPADLPHAAHIRQALDYVSVYVAPGLAAQLPPQPCLIPQTPLLRALLDDFCQRGVTAMADEWDTLQAQLLLQRMVQAGSLDDYLPDSHDRLLRPLLHALRAEPGNNTTLAAWAAQVHSTERTLARRFQQQLGMSFAAWRNRVRLLQALAWLKAGRTVADIAAELGYATPSAFIAMFARHTGMTPDATGASYWQAGRKTAAANLGKVGRMGQEGEVYWLSASSGVTGRAGSSGSAAGSLAASAGPRCGW